jgi:hypothetical protein
VKWPTPKRTFKGCVETVRLEKLEQYSKIMQREFEIAVKNSVKEDNITALKI